MKITETVLTNMKQSCILVNVRSYLVRWGSCAGDTLLPKNVQRRQWV